MALKDVTAQSLESSVAPAAADVVQRHLHGVWRYLRMHGADAHLADDLAQEAFVIALQKGAASAEPAATAVFLRRTARFLFLHHVRDRVDAVELADAVDELWQRDCTDDGGDTMLARLRECVGELQGRSRRAVELCYGVGKDAPRERDAAAHELGLQPNGLKTLLQRVRQQLRTCLERRPR